ncbi:CLU central domain [Trypanosoma melophagium]|uniref:CLU central domain n=1 Tax=Trypanosoma melophagium TaxID=715481 RepID=UPI00351A6B19|nr:CLU central domain [Trypanosoma melophagium]
MHGPLEGISVITDCEVCEEHRSSNNNSSAHIVPNETEPPWLPPSHLSAHLPFRTACEQLDRHSRDWNDEFQRLWDEEWQQVWGTDNRESLEELLNQYESYCLGLVENLCQEGGSSSTWSSKALQFPDCFRVGNIMLRVWRDDKLGLNMQRCFRVLLDCKAPRLAFPLTAAFRYYNVSITAQAVIPIPRGRAPLYRGDGVADPLLHSPLRDYLSFLLEALNVIPHGVGAQSKHLGVEVYEGADMRLYLLNPIGLLPPVNGLSLSRSVPLRRWWHIVRGPPALFMQPPLESYDREASSIPFLLFDAIHEVGVRRHKAMVRILHENGLNICLLGKVLRHLLSQTDGDNSDDDDYENRENLSRLIGLEIIARAVRRVMYNQVTLDCVPRTIKTANSYLARAVSGMMDTDSKRFIYGLIPTINEMFPTVDNDGLLQEFLQSLLRENTLLATKRLCSLCGFILNGGIVERIDCIPSAHNFSSYVDINHESAVPVFMLNTKKESDVTRGLYTSLILPYHVLHHLRAGRLEQAMRLSRCIVAVRAQAKRQFLYFEALINAAIVTTQCGDHEGAKEMLKRARTGMIITPAVKLGVVKNSGALLLPRNNFFLPGRIAVEVTEGFLHCYCEEYVEARKSFISSIDLGCSIDASSAEFATHLLLLPFMGLLETAVRSLVVTIPELLTLWKRLRNRLGPSIYGATVCEQLASLLIERGMYEMAVEQLRGAMDIVVLLLGDQSYEAGVLLNKLAFVYYTWDVKRFGVLCICLLQFSETIMIETKGDLTVSHLCVVENTVMTLMMRGNFVEASRRLRAILNPTSQRILRIPKEHPVTVRLYETQERLKTLFTPTATVIIQRHWREYKRRIALKIVFEVNACLLQRVGRGMLGRKLLLLYSRGDIQLEELYRHDYEFALLNFSKPLLRASELLSKKCRNWNGEFQYRHQCDLMWDADSYAVRKEHLSDVERDFHTTVLESIKISQESSRGLTPVPTCSTSFVKENIVITRVAKDDKFPKLQNKVSAMLRRSPTAFFTAVLSDYVVVNDKAYFAQALIPVHHEPQFLIASDGKIDVGTYGEACDIFEEISWLLHGRSIKRDNNWVLGAEIVRAMDGMWYLTNGISFLISSQDSTDILSGISSSSPYEKALQFCAMNQQKQAVELMEQYILSRKWSHCAGEMLARSFLAYCRAAAGEVKEIVFKLSGTPDNIERTGWMLLTTRLKYLHGRALIRIGEYAQAIKPLMEEFQILKTERFHAYYAAYPLLDNALWLGRASRNAGKPLPRSVITFTLHVATNSEPTELLFETCAAMTHYCMESGELQLAEEFAAVRERKVKELDEASSLRYAKALHDHSQLLFRRGGKESYEASASMLTAAIRIVETAQPDSLALGIMLNHYGSLLTHMNKLSSAKKTLLNAQRLLQTHLSREHQEMISWRKNMKILENRIRRGAALRIQGAVRRWIERRASSRHLELEDPERYGALLRYQLLSRMKRLVVSEATGRIFIADEENELFYLLQCKQRQSLGNAKIATFLRQTRAARMNIHKEKLLTSITELIELEKNIRNVIMSFQQKMQEIIFTQVLWERHRLGRRSIIRENNVLRIAIKIWRMDNVQTVIRSDMLRSHLRLLLHLVSREESAWRKMLERMNRKKKRALGVNISRILNHSRHGNHRPRRRKNFQRIFEDLVIEEQVRRESIVKKEAIVSRDFFFGPLVDSEEDSSGIW